MRQIQVTSTGWWGVPGRIPRSDGHKVHAAYQGKPICGAKFHPEAEYQFCSHGLNYSMIECGSCRRLIKQEQQKRADAEELARVKKAKGTLKKDLDSVIFMIKRVTDDLKRIIPKPARRR